MRRQGSAPCVEKIRSELEKRLEKLRRDKILTKKVFAGRGSANNSERPNELSNLRLSFSREILPQLRGETF
jgi:hypothetical protein